MRRTAILLIPAALVVAAAIIPIIVTGQGRPDTVFDAEVADLQKQLGDASDPETRGLLAEKLRLAASDQESVRGAKESKQVPLSDPAQQAKLNPPAEGSGPPEPGPMGGIVGPAGEGYLIETDFGLPRSFGIRGRNAWYFDTPSGDRIVVWVGGLNVDGPDFDHGAVRVERRIDVRHGGAVEFGPVVVVPGDVGPLRVVGATGRVLTLRADDGKEVRFNVETSEVLPGNSSERP